MESGVRDGRPPEGGREAMAGLLYFVVCVCVCVCGGGVNRLAERWWLAAVSTSCSRMLLLQGFQNKVKQAERTASRKKKQKEKSSDVLVVVWW